MNILEKDLEDLIFEGLQDPDGCELLQNLGFYQADMFKKYKRQYNLSGYGIVDILGACFSIRDGNIHISVDIIELKKDRIDFKTFEQALRYYRAIDLLIDNTISKIDIDDTKRNIYRNVNIIMIGTSIDLNSSFVYLPNLIWNVHLYTVNLDLGRGLRFKKHLDYFKRDAPLNEEFLLQSELVDFKSPI
jgi:hypothetical protein